MKYFQLTLALILALVFSPLQASVIPTRPAQDADVFQIGSAAELLWFAEHVNSDTDEDDEYIGLFYNARLTADIDVTGETWPMMGVDIDNPYVGTFDGNHHTITGINVSSSEDYVGMFCSLQGTVKDLGLVNCSVSGKNAGLLAGIIKNEGSVTNCYFTGTVTGSGNLGAMCGRLNGVATNCYAYVENMPFAVDKDTETDGSFGKVNNCYTLSFSGTSCSNATQKTSDEFASGEVAYLLNGSNPNASNIWGQLLHVDGADATPVFCNGTTNIVYKAKADCSGTVPEYAYINTEDQSSGHGTLTAHKAVPHDCMTNGTKAYWECNTCHTLFLDDQCKQEITPADAIDHFPGHKMNTDSTYCSICNHYIMYYTTYDKKPVEYSRLGYVVANRYNSDGTYGTLEFSQTENSLAGESFKESNLESISLPKFITALENGVFYECLHLKNVIMSDELDYLSGSDFQNLTALESIRLSKKLSNLPIYTFKGCTSLRSITLPAGIKKLGISCFNGCKNLSSVQLSDSLTRFASYCFKGCTSLQTIDIPARVDTIRAEAFMNCTSLSKVDILSPKLKLVEENAFANLNQNGVDFTLRSVPRIMDKNVFADNTSVTFTMHLCDSSYVENYLNEVVLDEFFPTITSGTITHKVKKGWNTFVCPFDTKSTEDVQLYSLYAGSDTASVLSPELILEGNTPGFLYSLTDGEVILPLTGGTAPQTDSVKVASLVKDVTLCGTYSNRTVRLHSADVNACTLQNGTLIRNTASFKVPAFEAWFETRSPMLYKKPAVPLPDLRYLMGDINSNGKISIADVSLLIGHLKSGSATTIPDDVNGDHQAEIDDISSLREILLGKQPQKSAVFICIPGGGESSSSE